MKGMNILPVGCEPKVLKIYFKQPLKKPPTFRAEKRFAQASAHPLPQAQGGLFCVLTVFVCWWSSE